MRIVHKVSFKLFVVGAIWAVACQAFAEDGGAGKALSAMMTEIKAKGLTAAAAAINSGAAVSECKTVKDLNCVVLTSPDALIIVNSKNTVMVNQKFPDLMDVDGNSVTGAFLDPMKAGKTAWEGRYKFSQPGGKQIVQRAVYCQKIDASHAACVSATVQ